MIEAYCNECSYPVGAVAEVCVSTDDRFDVVVERWGAERRPAWRLDGVAGRVQPTPVGADADGCGWEVSVRVPTDAWPSGFYLVTLTTAGGAQAHTAFVVRGTGAAPWLLVLATNTWNAYNVWGGASLYTGATQVAFRRPWAPGTLVRPVTERDDRKARPVYAGEAPDADGEIYEAFRTEHGYPGAMGSAGWFTHERRFVEWAERAGLTFDLAVSADLGTLDLTPYRAVVGVGHDEYWSAAGRESVEAFVAGGGNYVSLSGNTMFWQVRPEPAANGGTTMVCHKYAAPGSDPAGAATTGMWADPVVGRPECSWLGAGSMYGLYHRFGQATPRGVGGFVVYRPDHPILAGTGLRYGDVVGAAHGVVGYETVGCLLGVDDLRLPIAVDDPDLPAATVPYGHELVAVTPSSNLGVGEYPKSISAKEDQGDLEYVAERLYGGGARALARVRHGNAVISTCRPAGPDGGQVVVVGSTDWVFGLSPGGGTGRADPLVEQITANILGVASTSSTTSAAPLAG